MAKQELKLGSKKPAEGENDPNLQELLEGQQPNAGGTPTEGEQPTDKKPTEGEQKPNKPAEPKAKTGNVTFYTRVGDPFDSKTGKERPCVKHVVTRAWWLVNKDSLSRLGYNVVKVEGE